jgi:S1-C subfamily serine protease
MADGPTSPAIGTPPPNDPVTSRPRPRVASLRSRGKAAAPFIAGAAFTLGAVLLYGLLNPVTPPPTRSDIDQAIASALASVTPPPAFSQTVYQAVQPSLVLIQTTGGNDTSKNDNHDGGLGSGVVVTLAGDILTSLHVVDGSSSIKVTFADGSTSAADVVSTQPDHDIAVIRAQQPPQAIVPAVLGNPQSVQPGSEAYALGSPFGLYGSVSAGVISGLDRSFKIRETGKTLTGLIQIDAAVNPGNSGGALVDRDGRLIGIVTALVNPTPEDVFIGIGLAVPIDVAGGGIGLPAY